MSIRCAFLIDPTLPLGLIANTAAILSMTLGRDRSELIGPPVTDGDGVTHPGITTVVLPMLAADAQTIAETRQKALTLNNATLGLIDVTETAQRAKAYGDYEARIGQMVEADLRYLGLCLYGPSGIVRSLTGTLPLLR
ncbi:MAG: DUF2000 domain-containing protein [Rhodospirillum sp.]|nr:DUF2000 domain-containing protein [Rhodospirillum sp.]MCF8487818.1 DUF2000 domain-containing protein [Rhodospirillum sp.]